MFEGNPDQAEKYGNDVYHLMCCPSIWLAVRRLHQLDGIAKYGQMVLLTTMSVSEGGDCRPMPLKPHDGPRAHSVP